MPKPGIPCEARELIGRTETMSRTPTSHSHSAFYPGAVRPRPRPGDAQAHPGVAPLHPVSHRNTGFQSLPRPLGLAPYHYEIKDHFPQIAQQIHHDGKLVLHVVGDTGGVKDGEFQDNVAEGMISDLNKPAGQRPHLCYHVGDVVYFTGAHDDYYAQFYEPYAHYDAPIIAIPGNHDGEVDDPAAQTSLDGWVDYFMQEKPDVDPISKDCPRVQLSLPNVYWTLVTDYATIIGLYTNVPEGGSVDSVQKQWVTNEFATAPDDRALIVALHHPIYSFDSYHSGSSKMADVIEAAIRDTGRVPNLVLSGHVHNYQRIEKQIAPNGAPTTFIVQGNGGYHNLHKIAAQNGDTDAKTGAKLIYGAEVFGYSTMTITKTKITVATTEVDKKNNIAAGDHFEVSTAAIKVKTVDPLL
jgi:hypothetical protein